MFRKNAIKNLHAPEETHNALTVITPTAWLVTIFSLIFLTGVLLWVCCGHVVVTVPAIGIIIPEAEFSAAEKLMNENIQAHQQKVLALRDLLAKKENLYKKHYLTISEVEAAREVFLAAKEELAMVSRQNYIVINQPFFTRKLNTASTLDVLVFVTHAEGKNIHAGMQAYVLPGNASFYADSNSKGKVISVSDYPVSKEAVYSYLGNMSLVDEFFANSAPFMIKIRLDNHAIEPGTTVNAKIVSKICSPLQLIISQTHLL